MPHAAHFLERLDRVPRSLTDYALDLYRDDERVRWILHYAHLPKEVERVALALEDGGEGPYIVVTRQGHFVTALGAGMKPSHLHVLTRSQVDTFSDRVVDARARHELAKEIVAEGKKPEDMLGLLTKRPWGLSREEITAIAGWVPLMHLKFFSQIFEVADLPPRMREMYLTIRKKHVRRSPQTREALVNHWRVHYGIGARYVLGLMGDLAWAPSFGAKWDQDYGPTWLATDSLIASLAIRGAWAAGRLGKPLLPAYKRALNLEMYPSIIFDAVLGLTTIGLRHASARDDARRILSTVIGSAPDGSWTKQFMPSIDLAFDDPDAALEPVVEYGRKMVIYARQKLPPTSAYRFEREDDVPRDLALSAAACQTFHAYNPFVIQILPWVAKLTNPEELYLPEDLERALRPEPTPELVVEVIERHNAGGGPKPVAREEPKLGRNDLCACGSGKKFKKCCGA